MEITDDTTLPLTRRGTLLEQNLIKAARHGDTGAFTRLCEPYRRRVWRVVATVTKGGADTDDLAQDAILKAWSSLKSYRAEASFEAWLCRIALNVAHDYIRSAWKRRVLLWSGARTSGSEEGIETPEFAGLHPGPEGEAERHETQRRVRAAVARLKEQERVPIWLIYFEEFSLAEVARLEELSESTVRSRVKAGLKRLERNLSDWHLTLDADSVTAPEPEPKDHFFAARSGENRMILESIVERQQSAVTGKGYR